jgi:uncharacterized membrane protein YkvA (DUF1232 family)
MDLPKMLSALYARIRLLKKEALTLWYALKHPGTPLWLKVFMVLLVAYFFSPIDLIPDFIPVLGMLDELIIIPAGVWLLLKLMPPPVVLECQQQVEQHFANKKPKPRSPLGAMMVFGVWLLALYWVSVTWLVPWVAERSAAKAAQSASPPLTGAAPETPALPR